MVSNGLIGIHPTYTVLSQYIRPYQPVGTNTRVEVSEDNEVVVNVALYRIQKLAVKEFLIFLGALHCRCVNADKFQMIFRF